MLNEKILELRRKLNESVITKKNYKETYKLSIELDELIAKYYGEKLKQNIIKKKQGKSINFLYFFRLNINRTNKFYEIGLQNPRKYAKIQKNGAKKL